MTPNSLLEAPELQGTQKGYFFAVFFVGTSGGLVKQQEVSLKSYNDI